MKETKHVLIVCTGNVCRSPMAWGLLRRKLEERGLDEDIIVETAGIYALDDQPPSRGAQEVLAQRGIDISHHRARTITPHMLQKADLVLVMTEDHRTTLFHRDFASIHKLLLLSELAGEHADVEDPYGKPRQAYEKAADIIEDYLERGMETLLRRLGLDESA